MSILDTGKLRLGEVLWLIRVLVVLEGEKPGNDTGSLTRKRQTSAEWTPWENTPESKSAAFSQQVRLKTLWWAEQGGPPGWGGGVVRSGEVAAEMGSWWQTRGLIRQVNTLGPTGARFLSL